jgi:hypothetical protein
MEAAMISSNPIVIDGMQPSLSPHSLTEETRNQSIVESTMSTAAADNIIIVVIIIIIHNRLFSCTQQAHPVGSATSFSKRRLQPEPARKKTTDWKELTKHYYYRADRRRDAESTKCCLKGI